MRLATVLTPVSDENLQLAAQCGVTDLVLRYPYAPQARMLGGLDIRGLALRDLISESKRRAASFGLDISVVEGYLPIENLKLGIDDGTELRAMGELVRAMGDSGVELLCYNFMAGTDWARTRLDAPERGGALVTAFELRDVEQAVLLGHEPSDMEHELVARGRTSADLWRHLDLLLGNLLPIAESSGVKFAMHPDDPPLACLLGKPRIMHSPDGFFELLRRYNSPSSGVCFCVGTFVAMGCSIPETIRAIGEKIFYVHFRDVRGSAESFAETFHDNGPTDMAEVMRALRSVGFRGPMRPDHVPQLVGEEAGEPGYTMLGRLFAYGYIRGLMHATEANGQR